MMNFTSLMLRWCMLAVVLLCISCGAEDKPPAPKQTTTSAPELTDAERMDIQDMVARQDWSGLATSLSPSQDVGRGEALRLFQTKVSKDKHRLLKPMLADSNYDVRKRALFYAGQQQDATFLPDCIQAFNGQDSSLKTQHMNRVILESIGKCGDESSMKTLTEISNYTPADSILVLGQVRGLFQLMLRGYSDRAAQEKMVEILFDPRHARTVRTVAGTYLTRAPLKLRSAYEFELGKLLTTSPDPAMRSLAARITGRLADRKMGKALREAFNQEKNPAVRYDVLNAMHFLPAHQRHQVILDALRDEDDFVRTKAGEMLIKYGQTDQASDYWDTAEKGDYGAMAKNYFAAATVRHLPFYYAITRREAMNKLYKAYAKANTPWQKIDIIHILGYLPSTSARLVDFYKDAEHPAIKTSIIHAMGQAMNEANATKKAQKDVLNSIRSLIKLILEDREPGPLAAMTELVQRTDQQRPMLTRTQLGTLVKHMSTLKMPAELETYDLLNDLLQNNGIDSLTRPRLSSFAKIDRDIMSNLTEATRAIITTTKGDITLTFFPEVSPQSVSNFIQLAKANFYDGKAFHRVVPHFVAQIGCPVGDGYGGLDYTLPTEIEDVHYDAAGFVGMASAGPNTESSQWFITLSPTPHLDGRYTIFAQVSSGMQVARDLRIGDTIEDIKILN